MLTHCIKAGWSKTACGLDQLGLDVVAGVPECKTCCSALVAASVGRAWRSISVNSVRHFYFKRAGIGPVDAGIFLRTAFERWPVDIQRKMKRQMQSSPELARLMGVERVAILGGSVDDKSGEVGYLWAGFSARNYGCCPTCKRAFVGIV